MVYRYSFYSGHQKSSHSSFISGWLVLLLQVKTQHPQTSVHGILFLRQLHIPSHPHLHPHFIRFSTASEHLDLEHLASRANPTLRGVSVRCLKVMSSCFVSYVTCRLVLHAHTKCCASIDALCFIDSALLVLLISCTPWIAYLQKIWSKGGGS